MEEKTKKSDIFPQNFLWGASTAAHQVEGGTFNQWTVWELAHAADRTKTASARLSHLPSWQHIKNEAEDPDNYTSDKGVDHYHKYHQDFDLIKRLNFNSLRFGIEWSRIEPSQGEWDEKEIEHYRGYIKALKARGIEPVLNIWHWTHPVWFEDLGAFKNKANLKHFGRFVEKLMDEYGSDLNYIVTINEPNVYVSFSYLKGEWPPAEKSLLNTARVYRNLARAHKQAYKIIKAKKASTQVGVASQLANIQAKRPHNFMDQFVTKVMRYVWNWWFVSSINKYQDFVGFNYYFTDYYKVFRVKNPSVPLSDLGWYMEPEGLYPILVRVWERYKKPIIITENGLADRNDQYRQWWIEETIVAMERALSEGVDLRGYFHWSLLDNFEWAQGWWPKFGLVEVDRKKGMKRTIRPSALWFADKIKKLHGKR